VSNGTNPACTNQNTQCPTNELPFENLQMEHAKATQGKKQVAEGNASSISSKKQKKAEALAEPTAKHTLKYMVHLLTHTL
jgi:hypothetical protein